MTATATPEAPIEKWGYVTNPLTTTTLLEMTKTAAERMEVWSVIGRHALGAWRAGAEAEGYQPHGKPKIAVHRAWLTNERVLRVEGRVVPTGSVPSTT